MYLWVHVLHDAGMRHSSMTKRAVTVLAVICVLCGLPAGKRGLAVAPFAVAGAVAVVVLALVVMAAGPAPDPGH